jgi:hypothetical protein
MRIIGAYKFQTSLGKMANPSSQGKKKPKNPQNIE